MADEEKKKFNIPDFKKFIPSIKRKSWLATILFFAAAFVASLMVWWASLVDETPNPQVVFDFKKNKDDFQEMSRKVDGAISKLQDRKKEFDSSQRFDDQRELFRMPEVEGTPDEEESDNDDAVVVDENASEGSENQGDEKVSPDSAETEVKSVEIDNQPSSPVP